MPETFPKITFNDKGVCNFCLDHKAVRILGETKLREILQADKGGTYDCAVPISGGKDSTYVLYYAIEVLKLKVIAVNYDSGFQSDLARENMQNICRILNVPFVVRKADYENQVKMLREILRISEIVGSLFGICGNCEVNIRTVAMNTAKENKAPLILYGSSRYEETGIHSFEGIRSFITKISKRNIVKLLYHVSGYSFYSIRQRMQMKVPIRYRFVPIKSVPFPKKGIRVINFYDYIEWDSIDKGSFLKEKLGWKSPGDHAHRFDCLLHCLGNHKWLKECGISTDGFNYSTMIRGNRMKREDALLIERAVEERLEKECLETIEKIGLKDYKMPEI